MAVVGNLVANLSLNTAGFSRGAKHASTLADAVSTNIGRAFSGATKSANMFAKTGLRGLSDLTRAVGVFAQGAGTGLGRVVTAYGKARSSIIKAQARGGRPSKASGGGETMSASIAINIPYVRRIGASIAAAFGVAKSLSAILDSIANQRKLEAVLTATGGAAGVASSEILGLASDLQKVTNFEDEATVGAASVLASFKEVQGANFKNTLIAAQDLTSIMGGDLTENVTKLGRALSDPVNGMNLLRRSGVLFTEQQKQQVAQLQKSGDIVGAQNIVLQQLQSKFGGAAKAVADPWTKLQNQVGEIAENLGRVLLPAVNVVADAVIGWIGPIAEASDAFSGVGKTIADVIDGALFTIHNFVDIAKMTLLDIPITFLEAFPQMNEPIAAVAAFFIGTFSGLQSFFGAFVNNVISGFREIANFATAVGAGISAAFSSITSGDFAGAAGAFGDAFAKELSSQKDELFRDPFKEFSTAFTDASTKARQAIDSGGGLTSTLTAQRDALANGIAEREQNRAQQIADEKKRLDEATSMKFDNGALRGTSATDKPVGAVAGLERNSKEAFSAIQAAIRGGGKDPQQQVAKNTDKMIGVLQQIADNTASGGDGLDIAIEDI